MDCMNMEIVDDDFMDQGCLRKPNIWVDLKTLKTRQKHAKNAWKPPKTRLPPVILKSIPPRLPPLIQIVPPPKTRHPPHQLEISPPHSPKHASFLEWRASADPYRLVLLKCQIQRKKNDFGVRTGNFGSNAICVTFLQDQLVHVIRLYVIGFTVIVLVVICFDVVA